MEFRESIGLAAHSVGIGSFVYLRRILKGLIEEAHTEAKSLNHYPIMKLDIEMILDEKLEKIESQKKIIEAKKSIDQIQQSLVSG